MADWNNPNPINTNPSGDTVYQGFVKAQSNFDNLYNKLNQVKKLQTGTTAPSNPAVGELWFDENTGILKRYDGTSWVEIAKVGRDADTVDGKQASDLANVDLSNITSLGKILDLDGSESGLDADMVRGLPADFGSSFGTAGYQKLPSGLIIQWGIANSPSDVLNTITFPIAFPNACVWVGIGGHTESVENAGSVLAMDLSPTGFVLDRVNASYDGEWNFFYLAIGY